MIDVAADVQYKETLRIDFTHYISAAKAEFKNFTALLRQLINPWRKRLKFRGCTR